MLMASPQWMFETDLPEDIISNSLRFNDGDSAHLTFTPGSASSATDRRKITHSVWVKRGALGTGTTLYSSTKSGGSDYYQWRFSSDDKMTLILDVDDSNFGYDTEAVFRDTTNWYHFVLIIDTTQSTNTDRVKLYANGVLQTLNTKYAGGHVSQNFETYVMDGTEDAIGEFNYNSSTYFDGYMAEFVTTIGQNTAVTDFGKDVDGVWLPKDTSGLTFGGNGFRLQFKQTGTSTDASGMGADTSGNTNHFAPVNLAASDVVIDTPENNFCTINFQAQSLTSTVTSVEGNLFFDGSTLSPSNYDAGVLCNFGMKGGRWYWETRLSGGGTSADARDWNVGFAPYSTASKSVDDGTYGQSLGHGSSATLSGYGYTQVNGGGTHGIRHNNSTTAFGSAHTSGDILGHALDLVNGTWQIYKNGTLLGTAVTGLDTSLTYFAAGGANGGTISSFDVTFNFGQDDTFAGAVSSNGNTGGGGKFRYTPPAGYKALCSRNLDEPAFSANPTRPENANDHFDIVTYTGNASTNNITFNMTPDMVWIANRGAPGGGYLKHMWDTSRGDDNYLYSGGTNSEATGTDYVGFQNNGFQIGVSWAGINASGEDYVTWGWKANGGTTTTNDASVTGIGTIDSVYQANPKAGFSIVTYTGTGSAGTIAHGLGAVPKFITIKNRDDSANWRVYHGQTGASDPETDYMYFNLSNALSDGVYMNDTAPTSSVFSIGTHNDVGSSGDDYLAYVWTDVPGFSKFGSYEGNANADGAYVHLGFRPRLLICKNVDTSGSWIIFDSKRHPGNIIDIHTMGDTFAAEGTDDDMDFLSNGFKCRRSSTSFNSAHTFVYMAWAEMPEKYSNAA